jgi:hypothetical protein
MRQALVLLFFYAIAPAQGDRTPASAAGDVISVKGCVRGSELKVTYSNSADFTPDAAAPTLFRLRGPKQLMKQLREHEGHYDEVSGIMKDSEGKMGALKEKQVGKRTRITAGVREERDTGTQPANPVLDVRSFSHVRSTCM